MAQSKQAQKRVRQNEVARLHNRTLKSSMRTAIRRVKEACGAGEAADAKTHLAVAMKQIDKCAKHHIIHENNAARRKSSLAKLVASAGA